MTAYIRCLHSLRFVQLIDDMPAFIYEMAYTSVRIQSASQAFRVVAVLLQHLHLLCSKRVAVERNMACTLSRFMWRKFGFYQVIDKLLRATSLIPDFYQSIQHM
ncbi:hypothetical protein [Paenibacillus taichungensis]|uniref:hypothetical protein n=1 Tax=Paenibacillus taichungensis TaxID=484184 RepID=UPI0038D21A83